MTISFTADYVVIGAGVVGLAVARELAISGREVVVVEAMPLIGNETSSRNSEVIHAGLYYPANSLKALTCVAGRDMLYAYCRERGISHSRTGKLVVAANEAQVLRLDAIKLHAQGNGADVRMISAAEAKDMEPQLTCIGALLSPDTGIVDSHGFMLSLLGDIEDSGGVLSLNTPVLDLRANGSSFDIECGGDMPCTLTTANLVNCAGLSAPELAGKIWKDAPKATSKFARGNYFALTGIASPFSMLVYPVPEPGGLGVHFTRDLSGRAKFGPDVEWTDNPNYEVNSERSAHFYDRIREYWPALPDGALVPDYVGIRPKLQNGDGVADDFVVAGPGEHGLTGAVHLLGIESPGLTASLALARLVADKLGLRL